MAIRREAFTSDEKRSQVVFLYLQGVKGMCSITFDLHRKEVNTCRNATGKNMFYAVKEQNAKASIRMDYIRFY